MTFSDGQPAGVRQRAEMHRDRDKQLRISDLVIRADQLAQAMRRYLTDFEEETLYLVATSATATRAAAQLRDRLQLLREIERMAQHHGIPHQGNDRG